MKNLNHKRDEPIEIRGNGAEKGLTISVLERKLGFGKSTIARWKQAAVRSENICQKKF